MLAVYTVAPVSQSAGGGETDVYVHTRSHLSGVLTLTFRTLIRHHEAFLENNPRDRWEGTVAISFYVLQLIVLMGYSPYSQLAVNFQNHCGLPV